MSTEMSTKLTKYTRSNTYYGVVTGVSLLAGVLDGRLAAGIFVLFAGVPAITQGIALLLHAVRQESSA